MKEDKMDRACSTHRTDEKYIKKFGQRTGRQGPLGRPKRR